MKEKPDQPVRLPVNVIQSLQLAEAQVELAQLRYRLLVAQVERDFDVRINAGTPILPMLPKKGEGEKEP